MTIPGVIRVPTVAVMFALLVPVPAVATTGTATIHVRLTPDPLSTAQATVELTSELDGTLPWVVYLGPDLLDAELTRIPPGRYRISVQLTGFRTATTQITVDAGDVLSLVAHMAVDGLQAAEESRFEVVDRHRSWYGTVFNDDQLVRLPASDSIWPAR